MNLRRILFAASFAVVPAALSSLLLTATATGQTPSFSSSSYPVGLLPRGLAIADLNGDGRLDLVTGNYNSGNVSVLLGTIGGGFGIATNFPAGGQPSTVAIGDLNGDGKPDLVVAYIGLAVLFGDGQGGFGAPITLVPFADGTNPNTVAIGDVNGDGKPDIVANGGCGSCNFVSVFPGDGQGGFGSATNYFVGSRPTTISIGDVNGDGKPDIVTPIYDLNAVCVVFGDGAGAFGGPTYFPVGSHPQNATIGDVNGDGKLDVVASNYDSGTVSVLLGDGHGGFAATANYAVGFYPQGVALGDINGDGKPDILVGRVGNMSDVSILLGNGQGGFVASSSMSVGTNPNTLVTADLNGDGRLDFVTANAQSNDVSVRLNTTPGAGKLVPSADAGPDLAVDEGALVTLDGSGSRDPNADPITFQWTQAAGPVVVLLNPTSATPSFYAPMVPIGGATLTFQLVVNDGTFDSAPDTVNVSVKNVNHPPIAFAGNDQIVSEGASVTLDGSGSADMDGDPITFAWSQVGGPAVTLTNAESSRATFTAPLVGYAGTLLTFRLNVSDGIEARFDEVSVFVENVNHPPVADAGPDQSRAEGTQVTLSGIGSTDPDGDAITYSWSQVAGPGVLLSNPSSPIPSFIAPQVGPGGATLVFQLVVNDGQADSPPDTVSIRVLDVNAPPLCGAAKPSQSVLWPPNHKLVPIQITGVSDPDNQAVTITVTSVTQDEPVNGLGDGDTGPDAVLQGSTVLIRAERSGTRNGRVYTIHFVASDGQGGTCEGSVQVSVPHHLGQGGNAVDDGQIYSSN